MPLTMFETSGFVVGQISPAYAASCFFLLHDFGTLR